MTAPTHPEPRPDDEGRETANPTVCWETGDRAVAGACPTHGGDACLVYLPALMKARALTPHPAPLGATDEGLREAARAFLAVLPWEITWSAKVHEARAALRASLRAGG